MVYLALLLTVASLTFWVYVLFDVIGSDSDAVRLLPKPAWTVIVLLLPKVGALLWFVLGRPRRDAVPAAGPAGPPPAFPEYEHPNRARGVTPEDDDEFLRRCRERAEEQRRRARRAQEERERGAHGDRTLDGRDGPEGREDGPGGRGTDDDPQAPSGPVA
ncbi:phospholipase D-like protein [Nocardiopsis sp. Huas11]|uniref:PLD nuclease N-terminal domain-containing protein n=1 Tax=Nocardiopsis sp. Huas11 TaxID=2183912 RepID=UPI000EACC740|nr:PLD nuclease N-terminal domain-containing protein [Nocardiopsis sp. Huas11]RKS05398.1 phospholipase D-like protein [Nocardiopsis sp. Huas11]